MFQAEVRQLRQPPHAVRAELLGRWPARARAAAECASPAGQQSVGVRISVRDLWRSCGRSSFGRRSVRRARRRQPSLARAAGEGVDCACWWSTAKGRPQHAAIFGRCARIPIATAPNRMPVQSRARARRELVGARTLPAVRLHFSFECGAVHRRPKRMAWPITSAAAADWSFFSATGWMPACTTSNSAAAGPAGRACLPTLLDAPSTVGTLRLRSTRISPIRWCTNFAGNVRAGLLSTIDQRATSA